jgi:hypothetical protein
MKTISRLFLSITFLCAFNIGIFSQKQSQPYLDYIKNHKELAIQQMKKYSIPASVTLAQGLLETRAGQSELAWKHNNHFGIKCGSDWKGKRAYFTDDKPNECFRSYGNREDSYEDHSVFLKKYSRYAALFELKSTDYAGWAKGLQKAGYATSKAYANSLINLIETYELYKYDSPEKIKKNKVQTPKRKRQPYISGGLLYVEAEDGDTYEDIAYDLDFKTKNLLKYNDVHEGFPLHKGDIVYLESKKIKADMPHLDYIVKIGDSMHSISQRYGIRLKSLYKLNGKTADYIPEEGDVLRLR